MPAYGIPIVRMRIHRNVSGDVSSGIAEVKVGKAFPIAFHCKGRYLMEDDWISFPNLQHSMVD